MFCCRRVELSLYRLNRKTYSKTTTILEIPKLALPGYQPNKVEVGKYEIWERSGMFQPSRQTVEQTFSMVLPPPNVTGKLHLGHALACTVQDVIVRRQRALGKNVLWLPGTDHAGIATQGVVEKYLQTKYNIDRHTLGRKKFNEEVWKWKEKHGSVITDQLRRLGASLDWSRQVFTMDKSQTEAVNTAFIELFNQGLVYRKTALVNWCVKLKSTISDIEVDSLIVESPKEIYVPSYGNVKFGYLVEFAYKVCGSNEEIVVASTMPETMLGDVAVAVHPEDTRYHHLHGKAVHHPFRNEDIPVIVDEFVDMNFGTGAVKITPAHSKIDYEVGLKHKLPILQVINENGCFNDKVPSFKSIKKYDLRHIIIDKLNSIGALRGIKDHSMTLPICSRSGDVIEYLPKEQWFLKCSELNDKARLAVEKGDLKIVPEKFYKNWLDWTSNGRDWCISRQLWWGHQIPAYKCKHKDEILWIAAHSVDEAKKTFHHNYQISIDEVQIDRDTDVLDTWFSSGIYPFSSLGWPQNTEDFKNFYPLSLMATGHDILGFWVHRMVILSLALTKRLPFNEILLHGIICDSKGAKMSKSRGNIIDPIDVINGISLKDLDHKLSNAHENGLISSEELVKARSYHKSAFSNSNGIPECGVDALRFTLLSRDIKDHFVQFDVDTCHTNKLFCNKIWNSVKYTKLSFDKLDYLSGDISLDDCNTFDRWILSRLSHMVRTVNEGLDDYNFHIAVKVLKTFIYNEFCDVFLEATKPDFEGSNFKLAYAHAHVLSLVLHTSLRCLAPFMVYLSHEIIPKIPSFEKNAIFDFNDSNKMFYEFPKAEDFNEHRNIELEKEFYVFLDVVSLARQLKGFYNISNKTKPCIYLDTKDEKICSLLNDKKQVILNLTKCGDLKFESLDNINSVNAVLNSYSVLGIKLEDKNIDLVVKAKTKLLNKIEKLKSSIDKLEAKFTSQKYLSNTPESVQYMDKHKTFLQKEQLNQLMRLAK